MKLLRLAQKIRAYALVAMLLWFGTHHIAPAFLHHPLHLLVHAKENCCPTETQFKADHPDDRHCDFCSSAGFAVLTLENTLPRAPQIEVFKFSSQIVLVTRVSKDALARAPPAR